jgi:hypothetical protein
MTIKDEMEFGDASIYNNSQYFYLEVISETNLII